MRRRSVEMLAGASAVAAALAAAGGAAAHHGTATYFVLEEEIELAGEVVEWRVINPHSFLTVRVAGPDGSEDWICEANGPSFIRRAGIARDDIRAGDSVTVYGAPPREAPRTCLLREIRLADGRLVNVNGDAGESAPVSVAENTSIYGVWMPGGRPRGAGGPPPGGPPPGGPGAGPNGPPPDAPSSGGGNGPRPTGGIGGYEPALDHLTAEGAAATAEYDPYSDDPAMRCSPVGIRRLWGAPGTPTTIAREGETVIIAHEWMDAVRTVHLDQSAHPADGAPTRLGHSIGWFEDDVLVIETAQFLPGVISQYVSDDAGEMRGLLHSDAFKVTERIRFLEDESRLEVRFTYEDPKYYAEDWSFPEQVRSYETSPRPMEAFNCVPDIADDSPYQ